MLMVLSAAYTLRIAFRQILFASDPESRSRLTESLPFYWGLVGVVGVLAIWALNLRRAPIIAYFVLTIAATVATVRGSGGWEVAIPLVIGIVSVAGLLIAGRHYL